MLKDTPLPTLLRPRLGVVVTTWSHENGHEYAKELVHLFPETAPGALVEPVVCPTLLESEADIPKILAYFADRAIDLNLLIPGNFTLDHVMPLYAQATGLPTVLWGMTTAQAWGAFVGVQQTLFPFKELGLPYRFVVGDLGSDRVWSMIASYARGAALKRRLKGLRVGLMGWRAEGMSDVTFDELALREKFGVQVVNIGLTRYARSVEAVPDAEAGSAWSTLKARFDTSIITPDEVNQGVKTYLAMQQLARDENLQAVTVECFHDHVGGPCLGCSLFNDAGIAASCESDVPGALIMAACQILTGQPTFHADAIKADLAENSAIWHHCGNMPTRLAAGDRPLPLRPTPAHIAPGAFGPAIQATLHPGPVTAVNLVGRHGTLRVAALEGAAVPYQLEFPGSAGKVVFPFDLAAAFEQLGNAGYGHHFALAQGHIGDDLAAWCQVSGVDYLLVR